jgi:DNA-binding transcriptional regulator YiaG
MQAPRVTTNGSGLAQARSEPFSSGVSSEFCDRENKVATGDETMRGLEREVLAGSRMAAYALLKERHRRGQLVGRRHLVQLVHECVSDEWRFDRRAYIKGIKAVLLRAGIRVDKVICGRDDANVVVVVPGKNESLVRSLMKIFGLKERGHDWAALQGVVLSIYAAEARQRQAHDDTYMIDVPAGPTLEPQDQLAFLVGVLSWSKPRGEGERRSLVRKELGLDVRAIRRRLGAPFGWSEVSRPTLAKILGAKVSAITSWESRGNNPSEPFRSRLLRLRDGLASGTLTPERVLAGTVVWGRSFPLRAQPWWEDRVMSNEQGGSV